MSEPQIRIFEAPTDRHAARAAFLAALLGVSPTDLDVVYGAEGKPRLRAPHDGLHFSTSYSGSVMAVAWSFRGPVGVDIEHVRKLPDFETLAGAFFPVRTTARLLALDADARLLVFWQLWTRLEAGCKRAGTALAPERCAETLGWPEARRAALPYVLSVASAETDARTDQRRLLAGIDFS